MKNRVLEIANLNVQFNGRPVLSNINMVLEKAWVAAVVGPNGGGKTTLLRVILGMLKPKTGDISVFGLSPKQAVARGLVGYLPQKLNRKPLPLTALEVVMLPGGINKTQALEALETMGVKDLANRSFWHLSGGQAQRVSLARVIARKPGLMLLDEPNTGIDTVSQEDFYKLLLQLREQSGITVLMTTHDVGGVSSFVDQVFCLNVKMHCHGSASKCITPQNLSQLYGRDVDLLYHPPGGLDHGDS